MQVTCQYNGRVNKGGQRCDLLHVTHMKNCEPLVSFPRLAIDNRKALSCLRMKFSSVGSRERGIDVSQRVLLYVIMEIFREEQEKRKNFFYPSNLITASPTSLSIKTLFCDF